MCSDMRENMAAMLAHQEQHKELIDKHEEKLYNLEAYKNKTLGVVGILGVLFGSFAGWLIHIFTNK